MAHEKGVQTTIRLYGFVEMDLTILPKANNHEIDKILDRECEEVLNQMKEDFWSNYKQINK